jgi:uncharacterized protein YndB with AHSA1/START domain
MAETAIKTEFNLTLERRLPAPRARVYKAWTDAEEVRQWWSLSGMTVEIADFDIRVGGEFRLGMRSQEGNLYVVRGEYRVVEPPAKLVHTWQWEEEGPGGEQVMQVTVEFFEDGDATRLVLTHEDFRNQEVADSHNSGWTNKLDCIEQYLREE